MTLSFGIWRQTFSTKLKLEAIGFGSQNKKHKSQEYINWVKTAKTKISYKLSEDHKLLKRYDVGSLNFWQRGETCACNCKFRVRQGFSQYSCLTKVYMELSKKLTMSHHILWSWWAKRILQELVKICENVIKAAIQVSIQMWKLPVEEIQEE